MNRKIIISLGVIVFVAAMAIGATMAYYGDTETSTGNTMTAGAIDLTIDYQCGDSCYYPFKDLGVSDNFFDYCDVKPGDTGEVTISWHVTSNKAWGRLIMSDLEDWEYGCTEPEEEYPDPTCDSSPYYKGLGEMSQYLTFTAWVDEGSVEGWQCGNDYDGCTADPNEGDNEYDENTYDKYLAQGISVAQFLANGINIPDELNPNTTYYVGLQWNLPFSAPNIIQSDSLVASIVMEVVQSRNNPNPWPATLVNGGFETGDFTGWNVNGPAQVVTSYTSDGGTVYGPKEGSKFAVLNAGLGTGVYTVVSQNVSLLAGQKLEGWAAYDAKDYLPFEDDAAVVIVSGGPLATPWSKDVSDVGNYGESVWEQWSWTAPADGIYTLDLKVRNTLDNALSPSALFDAHVIQ